MQQEWQTRIWRLEDAQRCWSGLILEADRWPQRVAGPGSDGYVIGTGLYNRIFDSGIRFDGDEWAEFDEEPPSEDDAASPQHSHYPGVEQAK